MSWETQSLSFEEITPTASRVVISHKNDLIRNENEQKRRAQLERYLNHKTNINKMIYHEVMDHFGQLLISDNKEEIINTILTDDCEIFLFNFAETAPVQYGFRHEGFAKLFEEKRVIRREVKAINVSIKRNTGFQICDCEVIDENKGSSMSQFSFEIFSFKGNRINKYRASYGSMPMSYNPASLFISTKKEKMLAKIKELNHAWADQPDLERIASLLPEGAEYKIYRWKDKKCFTFDKHNIVSEFKKCLEEEYTISSVVPYGISYEAQYIFGSYVYHLEGKHELSRQKFIWVSTCVYSFDQNFEIKKMSQQGELYREDETLIPFQVQSPVKENKTPEPPKAERKQRFSIFDTENVNFSFDIIVFGSQYSVFTGHIKGFNQYDILDKAITDREQTTEKPIHIDTFEDLDDPCYQSKIVIQSNKGTINKESHPLFGKPVSYYDIVKVSFENGKLAKVLLFQTVIPDPVPSPFDDTTFTDLNFRPKSEFV